MNNAGINELCLGNYDGTCFGCQNCRLAQKCEGLYWHPIIWSSKLEALPEYLSSSNKFIRTLAKERFTELKEKAS